MQLVDPYVTIIARTMPDDDAIASYMEGQLGAEFIRGKSWLEPEDLIEFAGRICYKSFAPGQNRNVTKIRTDQEAYIRNILASLHGSVTEHVTWTFVFENVSRIVTHELARHRVGTATSQESLRYVAFDGEFSMWLPPYVMEDWDVMQKVRAFLEHAERLQNELADHYDLHREGQTFEYKKKITSALRRFAPAGQATSLVWTANTRILRHVIEQRTAAGAEEEMRYVFTLVARQMIEEHPMLFGDFEEQEDGSYKPKWSKV